MTATRKLPSRAFPSVSGFSALAGLSLLAACSGEISGENGPGPLAKSPPGKPASPVGAAPGTTTPGPTPGQPGTPNGPAPGGVPPAPVAPPVSADILPQNVYAAKVKNVLTGLPLTDDELKAVVAKAAALPGLIDEWQKTPEFRTRMLKFFKQAFQQTQTDPTDYNDLIGANPNDIGPALLLRTAEEMFARTVLQLIDEGRPFTEVATTDRFMMNAPLMSILAFIDAIPRSDLNQVVTTAVWPMQKPEMKNLTLTLIYETDPATGAVLTIPWADSMNPMSPNFMRFAMPKPYVGNQPRCIEPYVVKGVAALQGLLPLMFGQRPGACGPSTGQVTADDWNTWRMVRIRAPKVGEERTGFWDLARLRDPTAVELIMDTPRIGFMSTLAFMANWPTNMSNQSRVITNQALIVGLNRSFDDRGTTVQITETADDSKHVQPGTACFGCHQTLDPMRDLFRQSYAISYFKQMTPMNPKYPIPAMGTFAVDGAPATTGSGIATFGKGIATHPGFAAAWTQKFCQFANSTACNETDVEFKRVAMKFKDSGFKFNVLIRELFSSPLVTYATKTTTATATGTVISIMRREAMCSSLENRLKLVNVCGLEPGGNAQRRNLALSVPGAGYNRGEEEPLMPHDPSMFFVAAAENLCTYVSTLVVDAGATSRYASTPIGRRDEAITDYVGTVMGLAPSDPRAAPMKQMLTDHLAEAIRVGAKPSDALRSTFIVACASPYALALGL